MWANGPNQNHKPQVKDTKQMKKSTIITAAIIITILITVTAPTQPEASHGDSCTTDFQCGAGYCLKDPMEPYSPGFCVGGY